MVLVIFFYSLKCSTMHKLIISNKLKLIRLRNRFKNTTSKGVFQQFPAFYNIKFVWIYLKIHEREDNKKNNKIFCKSILNYVYIIL